MWWFRGTPVYFPFPLTTAEKMTSSTTRWPPWVSRRDIPLQGRVEQIFYESPWGQVVDQVRFLEAIFSLRPPGAREVMYVHAVKCDSATVMAANFFHVHVTDQLADLERAFPHLFLRTPGKRRGQHV
jgi:hypothetical protein